MGRMKKAETPAKLRDLQQYIAVFHKEESLTSAATLFYVLHKGKKVHLKIIVN